VNKVLTRIEFEGEAPAGTITSQTTDPATNKTVALAYVRP
jgi:glycine cleavage system aminomethyltransferase T